MAAITRYHIIDLGTVNAASSAAAGLMEYVASPKGLRHMTGQRRAIIWGEGPTASPLTLGYLYLSDGALEAANELRLSFTQVSSTTADKIPETAKLLFGKPD
jgi:hypothetical protein